MKRTTACAIVSLAALLLCSDARVAAQQYYRPGNPYAPPPGGVYLPLVLGRGTASQNYITLVRPLEQGNQTFGALGQQIATNQQGILGLQTGLQGATGHPSRFLNYQYYFMNTGATAGVQGGTAGTLGARTGGLQQGKGLGAGAGTGGVGGGMQRPTTRMP
jgi:hypothetical protein